MDNWGQGYLTDLEYTAGFYAQQAPSMLRLACLLNGVETLPEGGSFTYCDLGCGEGLTALILAAANPEGRFYGVDFNPAHIMRAREIAAAAALPNIEFIERSFEDLPDVPLPEFDFITAHGVYAWVSPEMRQAMVRFIGQRLKPGGIVYLSYNAMPGWLAGLPMQRLLHDLGAKAPGRGDQRILWAISMLEKLRGAEARIFAGNEFVDKVITLRDQGSTSYLAHEYLNDHWHPMYHADVAQELSAAKLSYVGSADLLTNFAQFMVTPAQQELIAGLDGATLKETVRDLCCNPSFRQDVFIRGLRRMSSARQEALLRRITLVLLVARANFRMQLKLPAGNADLQPAYAAIADALAAGPRTIAEILDLPELRGRSGSPAGEFAGVLVGSAQAMPMRDPAAVDPAPADRLNRVLTERLEEAAPNATKGFAVPSLGSGIPLGLSEAVVFRSLVLGRALDIDELARESLRAVTSRGHRVLKAGVPVESEAEALAVARDNVRDITSRAMPIWLTCWPHLRQAAGLPA